MISRRWADASLGAKGLIVIALPILILLGSLASIYLIERQTAQAEASVRRTLEIESDLQEVQTLLTEAATGVRGYLLTGRDDFLIRYEDALPRLPKTLERLDQNTRDAEIRERLARVQPLVGIKLAGLADLRRLKHDQLPIDLVDRLVASKRVLDQLRNELDAMRARERTLLAMRSAQAVRVRAQNLWVTALAAAAGIVGALVAVQLFSSGIVRRVQHLARNAGYLERGEMLIPLPPAKDEIGQLDRRLEQAAKLLAAREAEVKAASQAKTDFLSRTSHELRTPLNAVLGFAQLLELDLTHDPSAHGKAGQIRRAGEHLLGLIDELLDIARIEAGRLELQMKPTALALIIHEATALSRLDAEARGIQLTIATMAPTLGVIADRQRLLQVVLNLLSNAIKYNRAGGTVEVTVTADHEQVRIAVRDTGPGITPEQLARLFRPFERLGAESSGVEGLGLGLALSKPLLEAMGGALQVDSEPGTGSTFTIVLTQCPSPGPTSPDDPASPTTATAMRTVLCIEDNASNLALVTSLIERRPQLRLIHAEDGAQGLAMARQQRPDLILLDLHLPDLNGERVFEHLRDDPAVCEIPVVILSADALPATRERLMAAGARDYLTKPLNVARFMTRLDEVLT